MAVRHTLAVQRWIERLYSDCVKIGAIALIYRANEPFHSPNSSGMVRITLGLPKKWQDFSENFQAYRSSPFAEMVLRTGKPVHFRSVKLSHFSSEQIEYLKKIDRIFTSDGVGFPLYGPGGNDAYCAILFDHILNATEVEKSMNFLPILQQVHVDMVIQSQSETLKKFSLSKREIEVLKNVSCGMGNRKIAELMNISIATVDTHLRRIFSKLETKDRTEASVKAISMGILRL
jgi:DNA-binding CsgD family transcriptional regulator